MSVNIAFLSTYPPRECGLATFTQDLIVNLDNNCRLNKTSVIAVSDKNYCYDKKVFFELKQQDRKSYIETAKRINNSDIDLLVIEHEYGIFGGECGEYLLDFIASLKTPFITTVHTVLINPSAKQKEILQILAQKSQQVVTMAKSTIPLLNKIYGISLEKIMFIPHGVPCCKTMSRKQLKVQHKLQGRTVISTFGLLSPNKGLEYGIEAVAQVVKKHPEVLYLILGQTHPGIKRESGESYREQLEAMVKSYGLSNNIQFVNKYLTQQEIIEYLQLSDIYMTPYLNKEQAVSGTLAYAIGYGRIVVSTPYTYAKQMLANGRGLLAEFQDSKSLAKCLNFLIENPKVRTEMEKRTIQFGKQMMWDQVADLYAKLFDRIIKQLSEDEAMVG